MSRAVVVKSFAELAELLGPEGLAGDPVADPIFTPDLQTSSSQQEPDLAGLLADLEAASATLAAVSRRDQEAKASALRDLERYESLVAQQQEAEKAHERAILVRREAEAIAQTAFADEARATARRVVAVATRAEAAARDLAEQRRPEAERLAAGLDLERLLAERRRAEEAEKAKAAAAERAGRLAGALAAAREALAAGRLEEARGLLGRLANDNPDDPDVASLLDTIAQCELAVKATAAEEALWAARREHRRDPEAAVRLLEGLDVEGLPEELARQVFGEWARACARLCRERGLAEPLRYAPDPGRGAVIAREAAGDGYAVVSSLGLGPGWPCGKVVGPRQVRRARPLR